MVGQQPEAPEGPEAQIDEAAMDALGLGGRLELWREHCLDDGL